MAVNFRSSTELECEVNFVGGASCSTQTHMAQKPLLWVETGMHCMRCVKGQSAMGCDGQTRVSGGFGLENSEYARYIQPENRKEWPGQLERWKSLMELMELDKNTTGRFSP